VVNERQLRLRDGTRLDVRPIGPADKRELRGAFDRMSPESRYRRFFSPVKELSDRDLAYLTEIDHHDHEALVAIAPQVGIVAVARFVRADEGRAEASIAVTDDWQGRGLGTGLLELLAERAREEGITHFVALVLTENRDALELFESFARGSPREKTSAGNIELLIELPEPGRLEGSLLSRVLREAARGVVTMRPWRLFTRAIRRSWDNRPGR
jgi:GNAT superfamily N-acetyltransferase